jgi:hypothetical protein
MIITPTGNSGFSWVPQNLNNGLTKKASTDKTSDEVDYKDALALAAKTVLAQLEEENAVADDLGGEVSEDVGEVVEEAKSVTEAVEDLKDAAEAVESAVAQETGVEVEGEDVADSVEIDISDISDVSDVSNDAGVEEIEIEITDDEESAESDKDEDKVPGVADKKDDFVKESDEDKKDCDHEEDEECCEEPDVEASGNGFVKLSSISDETKKKIMEYWVKQLKYPKDYVALMAKNYDK